MYKTATISEDKQYRYELTRVFNKELPMVAFVGLNPSIADADIDDPTINRCINYCKAWGYGGFYMVNLFAYRSTDPGQLLLQNDPVGPENDERLKIVFSKVDKVICCWGNPGTLKGRNVEVLTMIDQPYCLEINGTDEPSHPLFLRSGLKPIRYNENTISINSSKGKLKKQFNQQLKEIGSELNIDVDKLSLIPNNWKNHCICFSYEDSGILYGIKRVHKDKNKSRLVEIEKAYPEEFKVSEWWPMYGYLYSDISTETDFWTDIKEGKAKEKAKVFVGTILDKFNIEQY